MRDPSRKVIEKKEDVMCSGGKKMMETDGYILEDGEEQEEIEKDG